MSDLGRRSFLERLGLAGIGVASGSMVHAQTSSVFAGQRAGAISALRTLNTLQVRRRDTLGYGPLDELVTSDLAADFERTLLEASGGPIISRDAFLLGGDLVPGFILTQRLSADRKQYRYLLVAHDGEQTFSTDQTGIIQEGLRLAKRSTGADEFDFVGAPIQLRQNVARKGIGGLVDRISAFIFPVVYAQWSLCCNGSCSPLCNFQCGGFCISVCNSGPPGYPGNTCDQPAFCCNIGYVSCTWCCTACETNCYCCWVHCF